MTTNRTHLPLATTESIGIESTSREAQLHRALQITAAWLQLLTDTFDLDETMTRATITHHGETLADMTIGQALDLADQQLGSRAIATVEGSQA